MARRAKKRRVDYDMKSYLLTHSLIQARSIHELIESINKETEDLSSEEQSQVLSRVIGNQLVLIDALRETPIGEATTQGYLQRLSDVMITNKLEEGMRNGN